MFVQALAAYADQYLSEQLAEEAWEEKPVPFLVEIGRDGTFLQVVSRQREERQGNRSTVRSESLLIPKSPVNRNSGLHPLLAADDIKYVLGIGPWTAPKDVQNASERHQAFVELVLRAASQTKDHGLQECAKFYERTDQVQLAREALRSCKPGTLIALSVDGPIVGRPAVQEFWRSHYGKAFQTRVEAGGTAECMISGIVGPIAPTHDKIKGLSSVGGQASGVSLMSFDKPAFRSYGWEQNANSPVSPSRAVAYVLALNDLLRGNKNRKDIAGVAFVYWTKKPDVFDFMNLADRADPDQVSALLRFDPKASPDPNMFYMAGLSGNGARLAVNYWVAESLTSIKNNLKEWFEGLSIVGPNGYGASPPKLWQLFFALDRAGKPPAPRVLALLRRAVEGTSQPLGFGMLAAVLARLRHPAGSSPVSGEKQDYRFAASRIGLLRLCLNDLSKGENPMSESLDLKQEDPAYVCGRLLAEFENLQEAVYSSAKETKVNVTVADRYYSLASTSPKLAFPKLEGLAKAHFQKLRRHNPNAKNAIENTIAELHEKIGTEFPPMLSLDGQGRFALGYYHQKAEHNKRRSEYIEKKAAAGTESSQPDKNNEYN